MIEQYLGLVKKLAGDRARVCNKPFDDLYQEGCVALIQAADRLDERDGVKPMTFLHHRIYWAMFDYAYPNRRSKREPIVFQADPVQEVTHNDFDQVDAEDEVTFLQGRLSDKQRKVVELRSNGMKFSDIGTELGYSKQRAQSVYTESLQLLKQTV